MRIVGDESPDGKRILQIEPCRRAELHFGIAPLAGVEFPGERFVESRVERHQWDDVPRITFVETHASVPQVIAGIVVVEEIPLVEHRDEGVRPGLSREPLAAGVGEPEVPAADVDPPLQSLFMHNSCK